jgi:YD repeat-containing protein
VTDPNGNVSRYLYDSALHVWKSIETDGVPVNGQPRDLVTEFTYDRNDRTRTVRDASGNLTQFAYDAIGRLIMEVDPTMYNSEYAYDAAGNLTSIRDRLLRRREFVYDAADRLTTERWKASINAGGATLRTIDYAYNDANELISVSDRDVVNGVPVSPPRSSLAFSYDAAGRLATVNNAGTPQVPNVLLNYSHDAAGRLTRMTNTMPGAPGAPGLPAAARRQSPVIFLSDAGEFDIRGPTKSAGQCFGPPIF